MGVVRPRVKGGDTEGRDCGTFPTGTGYESQPPTTRGPPVWTFREKTSVRTRAEQ